MFFFSWLMCHAALTLIELHFIKCHMCLNIKYEENDFHLGQSRPPVTVDTNYARKHCVNRIACLPHIIIFVEYGYNRISPSYKFPIEFVYVKFNTVGCIPSRKLFNSGIAIIVVHSNLTSPMSSINGIRKHRGCTSMDYVIIPISIRD